MKKILFGLMILALMSTVAFAGTSDTQQVDVTMGEFLSITAPAAADITLAENGDVWDGTAEGDLTYTANVPADINAKISAAFAPEPGAAIALDVNGVAMSDVDALLYDAQVEAVDATLAADVHASVDAAEIGSLAPGTYTAELEYTISAD